jgi:hypothetical protein
MSPSSDSKSDREKRLAEALRANLRRRKQQQRERETGAGSSPEAAPRKPAKPAQKP